MAGVAKSIGEFRLMADVTYRVLVGSRMLGWRSRLRLLELLLLILGRLLGRCFEHLNVCLKVPGEDGETRKYYNGKLPINK